MEPVLTHTDISVLTKKTTGKVRDIYDLGDRLLIVATDRISAFDVVLPNGIPDKGKILTAMSVSWFDYVSDIVPNHLITADIYEIIKILSPQFNLEPYRDQLESRSMLVHKAKRIDVECIVRGYITGSGWKDYQETGAICGITLPQGLKESEKLPENIFTPSTKAESGHDENVSFEFIVELIGSELAEKIRDLSLAVYEKGRVYAIAKGIIMPDTKFEFGILPDGTIILIDEILTPDSSRFWPADKYEPGQSQQSFDKQFVRDYLNGLDWDKTPPAPELPEEIVTKTTEKYHEALAKLFR